MDKDKIEMKTLMESAAVAEYLTQLAEGFKSGVIVVEKDGESLTLIPAETAEVEVEARIKKDKARFSLEVTWRTASALDEAASLKISAESADVARAAKCGDKLCDTKSCDKSGEKPADKKAAAPSAAKPVEKAAELAVKPAVKPADKPQDKPQDKPADKPQAATSAAASSASKPASK
ncbi:MAG: hypothetical protein AUJ49_13690 [Desulfovibrionaceae bacterium CG1_02_65_16]|nr:MAG: hypothetical protein AUJ49_13690 [Desulfovibrionaceae bacterium CG1_02_65_16]